MALAQTVELPVGSDAPAWIGSYRILDCMAEGGMGRVFRALDTASSRMVAIKVPRSGTTAEIAGLCREAAALKRLRHPGIVRLLGEGTWNGAPWLALELLVGRTLLAEMEAGGN